MRQEERDSEQLETIVRYARRLRASIERFGDSCAVFEADTVYQDSCSLCLIQIGEAVNRLSPEFKAQHEHIPWRKVYGLRCHLVHGYESFDPDIVWDAIKHYLPSLEEFCVEARTEK